MKKLLLALVSVTLAFVSPGLLRSQQITRDALASFPPQTLAVEYSRPATLRTLPNYSVLRARYVGAELQKLENSLAKLGIQEGDIGELLLGWQPGPSAMKMEGLASGRFDPQAIGRQAQAHSIHSQLVGDDRAYCMTDDPEADCILIFGKDAGAFGTLASLQAMARTRSGESPSLGSDPVFSKLVGEVSGNAPIWGVAVKQAVPKWFSAWMPGQKNLSLDWTSTMKDVTALSYQVNAGQNVHLQVAMDCNSDQAASTLRQVLDGLKMLQSVAWQNLYPNQPNPFQQLEVSLDDRRVSLQMTASYAALEGASSLGSQ
ncbi:MAG: hypothetical protein ACRD3T_11290 [Terriglobia bacterium]